jgi:DNA polymerase-1
MKGFFFDENDDQKIKIKINKKKIKDPCEKCGLYKNCINPKMKYTGKGKKEILIIAEAPGKEEDRKGIQLIGQSGQLLRDYLKKLEINLDRDCWKTNAIICRPEKNKTPTHAQVNYCRNNLLKTVNELKPEKIITFGKIALQGLIGDKISVNKMEKWVGWSIPDQEFKCYIFPTYHPAYILRNRDDKVLNKIFFEHLENAIEYKKEFSDYSDIEKKINITKDKNEILEFLNSIENGSIIAFDYETTGLKPQAEGHDIVCMSIQTAKNNLSFPIFGKEITEKLKEILENKSIKKVAHNLKYEYEWSRVIKGIDVQNWHWDTMLAAHVLDNRSGICGLKFQTYINFGVKGYDQEIKKYLESGSKSNNAKNDIHNAPIDDLLLYCSLDSYFTYNLMNIQKEKLVDYGCENGFELLMDGTQELSDISLNGIRFDYDEYIKQEKILTKKLKLLDNKIQNSKEVQFLNKNERFNFNSTKQLRELLFDNLNIKIEKTTKTGAKSVDKETLESLELELTKNILKHRYIYKIKNTYLSQFGREAVKKNNDYYIHPNFNLHTVRSYRSSSSAPNFQNIPIRDDYAKKTVRGCLIPRIGYKIMEVDYGKLEVCISACYNKDPELKKEIENSEADMHRDMAAMIFQISAEKVTKKLRYIGKNKFVFPEFYGDYWKNCAKNIWDSVNNEQLQLLKDRGISNLNRLEKHIEEIEDYFWNEKFKIYTRWKERFYKKYEKLGYIKLKTGFICRGPMRKNEVLNLAVQGSAFHCLLWSLIRVNKWLKEKNMNSRIVGQIHDSIVLDIDPVEEKLLIPKIRQITCDDIREYWKWIIVPLTVDFELTKINEPWSKKEEI